MGVYYRDEKIGYSSRKLEKLENGYKISELLKVNVKVMDFNKEVKTITDAYLDSDFRLESFESDFISDVNMSITGRIKNKNLIISIESQGRKSEQTIPLKNTPTLNISMIPYILKKGLKQDRKYRMMMFDPSTFGQENVTIIITGKEKLMSMGRKQEAYKLKGSFKGIDVLVWLTETGEVLREETPTGFILIKEKKEDALKIKKPSIDLIAQVAVPFNLELPPETSFLKIKLKGIELQGLEVDGGRQSLKNNVVEIRKEVLENDNNNPSSPPFKKGGIRGLLKGGEAEFSDEYLKETLFIQSKDDTIVSLSEDIVKGENDPLSSAKLIYDWVYKNIQKVPTITIPMATEVLKSKRGDCNEHTTLFTALSRAAGIPTRIALGLAYKDGYFYYHAWPEIFTGQWVAIDPTLGQFPANAAHIRLLTGDIDRQVQLLSVIGNIKVEGLEYR
jgi:hypothetical protein